MNEQRSNFIPVVEHETIPPSDNRTSQRTQRETVTSDEQCRTVRHAPDVDEIEDIGVIAEVEEEVVPCALLVHVHTEWKVVRCLDRVRDMDPPESKSMGRRSKIR